MSFYQKQSDKIGIEQRGKVLSEIWFPTILHFCDINNYENLNKTWLREILKWRTNDQKGIVRSNARGWHTFYSLDVGDITDTVLAEQNKEIEL